MTLKSKTALVTGSSRSIGRAIAVRLARDGALVAINYVGNRAAAEETLRKVEAEGGQGFIVQADLGSMADVRRLAQETISGFQRLTGSDRLDVLVNNAGIAVHAYPGDAEEEAFDRIMAVNLKGPLFLAQALMDTLNDGGRIINISSSTTLTAFPEYHLYTAAKAGLNNLTRSLAKHLGRRGITVNTVAPGATDTDMNANWLNDDARRAIAQHIPLGRVGESEDIADVVAFLASSDARWVTGQYISASGGAGV